MANPTVQLRVPTAVIEHLEALAIRNGTDRSDIARRMIEACVKLNPISQEERAYARSVLTGRTERSSRLALVLPEPPADPDGSVKTCTFDGLVAPTAAALAAAVEASSDVRPVRPKSVKSGRSSPADDGRPAAPGVHAARR